MAGIKLDYELQISSNLEMLRNHITCISATTLQVLRFFPVPLKADF